jgi:hypothetical protein
MQDDCQLAGERDEICKRHDSLPWRCIHILAPIEWVLLFALYPWMIKKIVQSTRFPCRRKGADQVQISPLPSSMSR